MSTSIWEQAAADADATLHLPGGVPLFLRWIEAGSFRMGQRGGNADEEPVHRVEIAESFYLGTFVVTQEQWRAVAERCLELAKEPGVDPSSFKGPRRPVQRVNWGYAKRFCGWLNENRNDVGLPVGYLADLPMEAEWEYACRGGKRDIRTEYWNGDGEAALREVGWYQGNAGGEVHLVDDAVIPGHPENHPLGLYGMHGNVMEWCSDRLDSYRHVGAGSSILHHFSKESTGYSTLRGGPYWMRALGCCLSARGKSFKDSIQRFYGFRLGLFSVSDDVPRPEGKTIHAEAEGSGRSEIPSRVATKIF